MANRPDIQSAFDDANRTLDDMRRPSWAPAPSIGQRLTFALFAGSCVLFLLSLSSCGLLVGYAVFGR